MRVKYILTLCVCVCVCVCVRVCVCVYVCLWLGVCTHSGPSTAVAAVVLLRPASPLLYADVRVRNFYDVVVHRRQPAILTGTISAAYLWSSMAQNVRGVAPTKKTRGFFGSIRGRKTKTLQRDIVWQLALYCYMGFMLTCAIPMTRDIEGAAEPTPVAVRKCLDFFFGGDKIVEYCCPCILFYADKYKLPSLKDIGCTGKWL